MIVVVDQIYPSVVGPWPIGDGGWLKVDVQLISGRSQAFEGGQARGGVQPFSGAGWADHQVDQLEG